MKFKFEYAIKPMASYTLEYGLKSKPHPYKFNHPVGLSNGKHKFRYDTRDQIHIEEQEKQYVRFAYDLHKSSKDNVFIKRVSELLRNDNYFLDLILNNQIIKDEEKSLLRDIFSELDLEEVFKLIQRDKVEMIIEEEFALKREESELVQEEDLQLKSKLENELIVEKEKLLSMNKIKMLIIERLPYLLDLVKEKSLEKHIRNYILESSIKGLIKTSNKIVLERTKSLIEKELELLAVRKNTSQLETSKYTDITLKTETNEMFYEKEEIIFILKQIVDLHLDNKEGYFEKDSVKNIYKHISNLELSKEFNKDISKEDTTLELKLIPEEIVKDINNITLFLVIKELLKDLEEGKLVKITLKELFLKIELLLEKNYEKDLLKDKVNIELEKIITKEIFKDIIEKLLNKVINKEINKDEIKILAEKIITRNITIDKELKELEKIIFIEILKELAIDGLDKEVIKSIILEKDLNQLEKLPIGNLVLEIVKLLKKSAYKNITIDKDKPVVKAYREVIKEETDIAAIKELLNIEKEKSVELIKQLKELGKLDKDEKTLDLYKRFWFIRATEPLDWKIVPYSDYPYESDPIILDKTKELIPDNWQLDMVDVENKMYQKIDKHPIPFGKNLGNVEMALSIEIMIEMINILILLWTRLFYAFTGYTGTQAVTRLTRTLYEWLMLETSVDEMNRKGSLDHYLRCYRWIRWESEKVVIKAREDMSLSGNHYIDEFIFELIYYMENHHFDTMPLFEAVGKMDEFRALIHSDELQGDVKFVLDKVKGIRHRVIECKAKKSNE